MNDIHKKVLEKISAGLIQQKPSWKFRLEKLLSWGTIFVAGMLALYMTSFVLLVSHEMEFFEMLGFGPRGVYMIIHTFPILILATIVALIITMTILMRVYAHAYRISIIATISFLCAIGIATTLGVAKFDQRMAFGRIGERGEMPFLKSVHDRYRPPHTRPVARGVVIAVQPEGFILRDRHDEILAIIVTESTTYTSSAPVSAGDILAILGTRTGGMIVADIVKTLEISSTH